MSEWDNATKTRTMKIRSLERYITGYSYSSEDLAHMTDETFCSLIVENLKVAKKSMFNVLETAFELHRDMLLKDFEQFRDGIGMFSNEIRARVFKWGNSKSQEWLERMVDYDYRILAGLGDLVKGIDGLHKELLASGRAVRDLREIDEHTCRLKASLDEIVTLFNERDAVSNIQEAALEKTFDTIRSRIRRGF